MTKLNFFINKNTLVRLIMTGNIVAGKNNGGYKYGGNAKNRRANFNPPLFYM